MAHQKELCGPPVEKHCCTLVFMFLDFLYLFADAWAHKIKYHTKWQCNCTKQKYTKHESQYRKFISSSRGSVRVSSLKWKLCHTPLIRKDDWQFLDFLFKRLCRFQKRETHVCIENEKSKNVFRKQTWKNCSRQFQYKECGVQSDLADGKLWVWFY